MRYMEQEYLSVFIISFWNYLALIINFIAFTLLYQKANHNLALKAFFRVQFFMAIWLAGKILKTVAPTYEVKWIIVRLYYIGIYFSAISFFEFAYVYYKKIKLERKYRLIIYSIGIIEYLFVITNTYHYFFYKEFDFWGDSFGVLFYFNTAINYIFIFAGIVLCYKKVKDDEIKLNKFVILSIFVLCFALIFIYILWFYIKGETLIQLTQSPLPQKIPTTNIHASMQSSTEGTKIKSPSKNKKQGIAEIILLPETESKTREEENNYEEEDFSPSTVPERKILPWTTLYDGKVNIAEELGINYKYVLRDKRNITFLYLGERLNNDLVEIVEQEWGNIYTLDMEYEIKKNELFGDRVIFLNIPKYQNKIVLMVVKHKNKYWLMIMRYKRYYQSKNYLKSLFIE